MPRIWTRYAAHFYSHYTRGKFRRAKATLLATSDFVVFIWYMAWDIDRIRSYWFACRGRKPYPCSDYCRKHGCLRIADYTKMTFDRELKRATEKSLRKLLKTKRR
jgi:hypothetical protein